MNVPRGGYVLINFDDYKFIYSQSSGEYTPVEVSEDIITLIKYAYEKGKPVCLNNVRNTDENGTSYLYTALWGTVQHDKNNYRYVIPKLTLNEIDNTITFD